MLDAVVSAALRLCQSSTTRLVNFIAGGHDVEIRRVRRVKAMYRRRYAGRPMARLRAELRTHYAGLVLTCRVFPKEVRVAALGVLMVLAFPMAGPWGFVPLWTTVRRGHPDLAETLDTVDASELVARIKDDRYMGRPGYSPLALWRAYLASFILGLPSTNALIRRLQDDAELRVLCGFGLNLPHRTTFNRFISRLSRHRDRVDDCMAALTDRLAGLLPGLGEKVAVDATVVRSHSNPNRKARGSNRVSDPEASWTAKNYARSKGGKEWRWGYKYHLVADATYGIPLYGFTTTAKRHDSPELPRLLGQAVVSHPWLRPRYVLADRGYDSFSNHELAASHGATLICPARRLANDDLYEGIYTARGSQPVSGMVPMEYVRSEPGKGHLYRCPPRKCRLKDRKGVRYCHDSQWVNRRDNPRLFGPIRQGSAAWKALYRLRQAVERIFKSMKESRRLERHCVRGLKKISLQASMSTLGFAATFLVKLLAGEERPRWMVRKVA